MGFNYATVTTLLLLVGGTLGIALELLLLHTLFHAKQWLEARVVAEAHALYTDLVRASVDYAEEWARNVRATGPMALRITGTNKLHQAVQFVKARLGEVVPRLEADIHAELGRRRGLAAIAIPRSTPPPLPPKAV
jgi:hypothetical protein